MCSRQYSIFITFHHHNIIVSNEYSLTYYVTTHRQFSETFHQTHNLHYKPTGKKEKKKRKTKTTPKQIIENTMKQDAQTNKQNPQTIKLNPYKPTKKLNKTHWKNPQPL